MATDLAEFIGAAIGIHLLFPSIPLFMAGIITGFAGTKLSDAERAFLREAQPWGFILFKRNIAEPQAVRQAASTRRQLPAAQTDNLLNRLWALDSLPQAGELIAMTRI